MNDDTKDIWSAINSIRDKMEDVRVHGCSRAQGEAAMASRLMELEEKLTGFMIGITREVGEIRQEMVKGIHDLRITMYGILGTAGLALIGWLADRVFHRL